VNPILLTGYGIFGAMYKNRSLEESLLSVHVKAAQTAGYGDVFVHSLLFSLCKLCVYIETEKDGRKRESVTADRELDT